ncbi:MAG: hypothetical protein FWF57_03060 [Defluviitaleaceae bacterium]|nr:hypothetical protein [Defluviitaleaceae bacterium]
MKKSIIILSKLFLTLIIVLIPLQVMANENVTDEINVVEIVSFYWVDPVTRELIPATTNSINLNELGDFNWVDPVTGELIPRNLSKSAGISPEFRLNTTWETISAGTMPLLALNTQRFVGVHSSTNGGVQMRVVRNPYQTPLEFHATTRTVNPETGFKFTVPRGSIFYVQARMASDTSTVRFE